MNRVMVDLETLDTGPDAAIISIGAVVFDTERFNGELKSDLGREFYTPVSQKFQKSKWGRTVSTQTLNWWALQSSEARQVLIESREDGDAPLLNVALQTFVYWWGGQPMELWGNGATFDNVILRNAFGACSLIPPWHFTQDRCYRTLKNLGIQLGKGEGYRREDCGVHHNALADAKYQALYASAWLRRLDRGQKTMKALEAT